MGNGQKREFKEQTSRLVGSSKGNFGNKVNLNDILQHM